MISFKKLNYRLVYETIKKKEGEKLTIKKISDATGLGENSIGAALRFLLENGFIEEESQQTYFVTPLSQIN